MVETNRARNIAFISNSDYSAKTKLHVSIIYDINIHMHILQQKTTEETGWRIKITSNMEIHLNHSSIRSINNIPIKNMVSKSMEYLPSLERLGFYLQFGIQECIF
jgi:hypothetical protein